MAVGAERGQPPYRATDTEDRSCTDHTDSDRPLQLRHSEVHCILKKPLVFSPVSSQTCCLTQRIMYTKILDTLQGIPEKVHIWDCRSKRKRLQKALFSEMQPSKWTCLPNSVYTWEQVFKTLPCGATSDSNHKIIYIKLQWYLSKAEWETGDHYLIQR